MKLIVHIGDIKTGSTSIQTALAARILPASGLNLHYPCDTLNHNYLEPLFREGTSADAPQIHKLRRSMKKNAAADVCVISAERFSTLDPALMQNALATCFGDLASEISIIHYVRPHFGRAVSAYAEQVKIGATNMPLSEFINKAIKEKRFHSARRIQKWRNVFGSSYNTRIMSKYTLVNQDVVADFFSTASGTLSSNWLAPPQVNASLCAEGTEYVKVLQSQLDGRLPALRHAIGYEFEYLYSKSTPMAKRPKLRMESAQAAEFHEAHINDAINVDRKLGISVLKTELDSDYQSSASQQQSSMEFSNREIADKVISDLLKLTKTNDDLTLAIAIRNARFKRMIAAYKEQSSATHSKRRLNPTFLPWS